MAGNVDLEHHHFPSSGGAFPFHERLDPATYIGGSRLSRATSDDRRVDLSFCRGLIMAVPSFLGNIVRSSFLADEFTVEHLQSTGHPLGEVGVMSDHDNCCAHGVEFE